MQEAALRSVVGVQSADEDPRGHSGERPFSPQRGPVRTSKLQAQRKDGGAYLAVLWQIDGLISVSLAIILSNPREAFVTTRWTTGPNRTDRWCFYCGVPLQIESFRYFATAVHPVVYSLCLWRGVRFPLPLASFVVAYEQTALLFYTRLGLTVAL